MRRLQRRKRPVDYLLPFLILVAVGVIGVLAFQLWSNWDKQNKGDAYFFVAEGKAKLLRYGETDWDNAFSGTKLLLGDAIKTSSVGRVVVEFFNGTIVRMAPETAVTLTDLIKKSDQEAIMLSLDNGSVWVKGQKSEGVRDANYEVRTSHLLVKATGTVFEVERNAVETVRVFDGQVVVDVLVGEPGKERVADTISVGVGQEISVDDATLKAFEQNQSPSVLKAVSDSFKSTSWYAWNIGQDANPSDFLTDTGEETPMTEETEETPQGTQETMETSDLNGSTQESVEDDSANDTFGSDLKTPVITSPTGTKNSTGKLTLGGTVSAGTAKVTVVSHAGGGNDSYTLSKFKKGDTTWSYNVSEAMGNLKPGDNTYEVYAYDSSGMKSDAASITITYEKDGAEVVGDLKAPEVLTFNGGASSTVTKDTVKVAGSVSGAVKVVVNDYTLSAFTPGATSWTYTAKESLGNLKPGVNEYAVYSVDSSGNKSSVVTFSITYNKEAGASTTAVTQETTPATGTSETTTQPVSPVTTQQTSVTYGF